MIYALAGGAFVIGLFFAFMCFKTWKFFHVFMWFFVFAAASAFVVYSALVLKTRVTWEEEFQKQTEQLRAAKQEHSELLNGNLLEVDPQEPSLLSVKHEIRRRLDERGRVWRDCQKTGPARWNPGDAIQLDTAPPGPNRIVVNSKLAAFVEESVPAITDKGKVPILYLGEFMVTEATDTSVTIVPTQIHDAVRDRDQLQAIGGSASTWVLYERMPLDAHDVFAGMDRDQLMQTFPPVGDLAGDEQYRRQYESLIDDYQFDGQSMEAIRQAYETDPNRINRTFDPPPSRQWVKVKFLQTTQFDVNGDPLTTSILSDNPYDSRGRAQDPSLIQIDPTTGEAYQTEFQVGDTGVFEKDTADQLIASGSAQVEEPVYYRELNDYEYQFLEIERQRLTLAAKIESAQRDIDDVNQTIDRVKLQITGREEEIAKAQEDLANHRQEIQLVSQYRDTLQRDWSALKNEIRDLYRANKHYEAQLASLHKQITDEVERRVRQVAASSGAE